MSTTNYVPILKAKSGELRALATLDFNTKDNLIPLLELVPDDQTQGPSISTERLTNAATQIAKGWGTSRPVRIDARLVQAPDIGALAFFMEEARTQGVIAVPVVSSLVAEQDRAAARDAHNIDRRGICIRDDALLVLGKKYGTSLEKLLNDLHVDPSAVDVVLDLKDVPESEIEQRRSLAEASLDAMPFMKEWRSITIAASGFPVNLAHLGTGVNILPRTEWDIWSNLSVSRALGFADYAMTFPDLPKIDPSVMQPSASIRYSTPQANIIVRGRSVRSYRTGGFKQYNALSRTLTALPVFAGATFSWGDSFINQCAEGGNTGNLTTWRQVTTSHHLTLVVQELAKRSGT